MNNGSYSSGYAAGKAAGRSAGRKEARREFDAAEAKSVAQTLVVNDDFQQGAKDGQEYFARTYEFIGNHLDDSAVDMDFRGGFLWLSKRQADKTISGKILDNAQKILSKEFVKAANSPDFEKIARKCAKKFQEKLGIEFERGYAASMIGRLKSEDYKAIGFAGYIYHQANLLNKIDGEGLVERLAEAGETIALNKSIEHYGEFLKRALKQYGEQLSASIIEDTPDAMNEYKNRPDTDNSGIGLD
jgi:hypothetical protein